MIKRDWVEGPKLEFLSPCKFANCHSNFVELHYLSDKFGINLDSDDEGRITIFYDEKIYNTPDVFIDDFVIRDDDDDKLFIYRSNFSESIRIDKNMDNVVILPIADLDKLIIKMD